MSNNMFGLRRFGLSNV